MISAEAAIFMGRAYLGTSYEELDCINFIKKIIRVSAGGDSKYTTAGTNDLWNSDTKSGKYRDLTAKQMRYTLNGSNAYFSSTSVLKIPEGASNIFYNIMARNENTATEGTVTVERPVVCYGNKLLPYEPYHEQAITVQTSDGLNGIPVSSGGNYTDESGQQWICDEIDLERGVYIKRIYAADLTGTTGSTLSDGGLGFVDINLPYPLGNLALMCEQYPAHIQTKSGDTYWKLASANIVTISSKRNIVRIYDTASKAVTARVLYDLETPIETPLTAEEIAAYKALTAYAQTTVVQAKNVAGVEMDYQKDVNIVIKNLEDALAAATASSEGGS